MALETEHRLLLGVEIKKKLKEFSLALSFEAKKGCLGILGPSGCGKSMTLKSIAGIVTPDSGRIALQYAQGEAAGGRVLFDSSLKINETPQIRRVGYLFSELRPVPQYDGGGKYCRRLKGKGRKGRSGGQEVPSPLPSGH